MASLWRDLDDVLFAIFPQIKRTGHFSNNRLTFRCSGFEQLLDTRQTLGNVTTGHTTGMEGTKR